MPISAVESLLTVRDLSAGYGKVGVLHGIDFEVVPGEIVALLGPNGAGKTTLLRALSNLLEWTAGSATFAGRDLKAISARDAVRAGLVHVVEGHRVFTRLSVIDNVILAGYNLPRRQRAARVDDALAAFPEIAVKRNDRAGSLSGGQRQMLVMVQGLVRQPRLLMLDEPSAGLSPVLVDRVLSVATQLRAQGTAIILVEQLIEKSLAIADRVLGLSQGRIVLRAPSDEAGLAHRLEDAYLGQAAAAADQ